MKYEKTSHRCPSPRALSNAFSQSAGDAIVRHLDDCESCRTQWSRWEALVDDARALAAAQLSARAFEDGRAALLVRAEAEAAVQHGGQEANRWPWAIGMVAAAILVFVLWAPQPDRWVERGDASNVERAWPEPPLAPIEAPAAVSDAPVPRVAVADQNPLRSPKLRTRPKPPGTPAPKAKPTQAVSSSSEVAFREGWAALRAGQHTAAASWFAQVREDSSLAEDAAYWRGIALVRAGRTSAAIALFAEFVDDRPDASRRAEVAVLLGKLLQNKKQYSRAAGYLTMGLLTDDEVTKERARRGLEELGASRVQ